MRAGISGVKFHSLDIVLGMRNTSVKKHHRMFIAKLIVFCVYFVYALITCGCLFRFISCIVYFWLMFLPFARCYVVMLSNLSGFVNKFSPVDQFLYMSTF